MSVCVRVRLLELSIKDDISATPVPVCSRSALPHSRGQKVVTVASASTKRGSLTATLHLFFFACAMCWHTGRYVSF